MFPSGGDMVQLWKKPNYKRTDVLYLQYDSFIIIISRKFSIIELHNYCGMKNNVQQKNTGFLNYTKNFNSPH